jgi:hypothetical protein
MFEFRRLRTFCTCCINQSFRPHSRIGHLEFNVEFHFAFQRTMQVTVLSRTAVHIPTCGYTKDTEIEVPVSCIPTVRWSTATQISYHYLRSDRSNPSAQQQPDAAAAKFPWSTDCRANDDGCFAFCPRTWLPRRSQAHRFVDPVFPL